MIDFAEEKKRERKVPVSVRLPESIRHNAQRVAKEQSKDIEVTESDIYRQIIVDFFSKDRVHNVHGQEAQS